MAHMVPHEIESSKSIRYLAHDAPRIFILGEIGDNSDGTPTRFLDLGNYVRDRCVVDINDANRRAFFCKSDSSSSPHAGTRCCHHA
jgi:hypothetical protein